MKRFSTLLLYVTIAFLLLWQLPWCYNFFVVKPEKTPFTLYSFVIGDFALMGQEEGKGTVIYTDPDRLPETFIPKQLSTVFCLCFISAS
mgnify:CR=1 FL=1